MTVVSGSRQVRSAVAAMGVAAGQRTRIGGRVVGPALLGVVVSGALVAFLAPRLGYRAPVGIGWAWSLPIAAQTVVLVILACVLLRAPRD